jgi:hypothetical protein
MLPATLYLDGDFALKSLRAQPRVGSYLDVSSPWIFPFYLLTAFKTDRALLLNANGATRNFFSHLGNRAERNGTELHTKELGHLSGLSESFDTITCLARLSPNEKESELLRKMWQALNPGGILVLSLACTGADRAIDGPPDSRSLHPPVPTYDSELLKSRVLDVLGEPRSYAIYGEDSIAGCTNLASTIYTPRKNPSWRDSIAVGRYWRRCSSISQVGGRGILAMKFTKSDSLAVAKQVS